MPDLPKSAAKWIAVEFETGAQNEDLASWLIVQCGATGCEVTPSENAAKVKISASFDKTEFSKDELVKLRGAFEEYGLGECLHSLRIQARDTEDWLSKWKEGFEPSDVSDRITICPSWWKQREHELPAGRMLLFIEPGMAFGTGLHATTQYCLSCIEKFPIGPDVLDVGTGSGILAIAACLFNPSASITAIDIDPASIENAQLNFELNGVANRVHLLLGEIDKVRHKQFDTIFSNMTCEDIIALLPDYVQMIKSGGRIVCAGILSEKLEMLLSAVAPTRLTVADQALTDMWAGITLGAP
ncbi:MAG TPA: 50S ribosomal protein L11 methyltransferase [Candidatus Obscuribacterales bacterium]